MVAEGTGDVATRTSPSKTSYAAMPTLSADACQASETLLAFVRVTRTSAGAAGGTASAGRAGVATTTSPLCDESRMFLSRAAIRHRYSTPGDRLSTVLDVRSPGTMRDTRSGSTISYENTSPAGASQARVTLV